MYKLPRYLKDPRPGMCSSNRHCQDQGTVGTCAYSDISREERYKSFVHTPYSSTVLRTSVPEVLWLPRYHATTLLSHPEFQGLKVEFLFLHGTATHIVRGKSNYPCNPSCSLTTGSSTILLLTGHSLPTGV